ncbi:energy transducer TonB [candidate division KSB1 bacterium]|nr:energy transducer TonB [candidate division KSB1 bacterium]
MQISRSNLPLFALPKAQYRRRFELGLIFALSFTLVAFFFMRDWRMPVNVREHEPIILTVENIPPQTRQFGARRPPPPRPAIPIPTESEMIPEDETIEPTTLDLSIGEIASSGDAEGIGGGQIIPPRPLVFVVPEFSEEDRKKNIHGEVKVSLEIDVTGKVVKAVVIENTTGSGRCAQAALRAALASRFTPARNVQGPVKYWLIQPYRFDLKN